MGETKVVGVNELKKGGYVILDGAACRVTDIQISKPGKHGHAKIRMEGVGLIDEKKRVIVVPGHDNIDVPIVEKRTAQVLSIQGSMANVMDADTFETFDLEIPEDIKDSCVEGTSILYWVILDSKIMKQIKTE